MKRAQKNQFATYLAEIFRRKTLNHANTQSPSGDNGLLAGDTGPNTFREVLPVIHPADLADIVEELSEEQRLVIFAELDTEHASDTLEEIEPNVQRSLISTMDKERVADLIDEMTPAQAADVLSALAEEDADHIMTLMEHTEAEKIESLLEDQGETVVNLASKRFIRMLPGMTADLVVGAFRKFAEDADVRDYIYLVDHDEKLKGVVSLPRLLMAKPESHLKDIMITHVICLEETDTIEAAKEKFARYRLDALPVVAADDVIKGVVIYRDIVGLGKP